LIKRPAIFFDRDNTLIANDGYLGDPAGVVLIPGAAEAVARARALGYVIVTVSNQSGVARGMFTEDDVRAVDRRMGELLRADDPAALIDRHEYCPFHPDAKVDGYRQDSPLRKPAPGMIHRAAIALDLDTRKSWVVGDAPRDVEAGRAAGCRTILLLDPALPKSPAAEVAGTVRADFVVSSLKEAMDVIERERNARPSRRPGSTAPADVGAPPPPPPPPAIPGPMAPPAVVPSAPDATTTARLESLATQILQELKRRNEREHADFSVPKLLAGILQVLVLALLFVAYLGHTNPQMLQTLLLFSIVLQTMVASLLLMSSHR
jgi:D-glycero-D-manno-heptose 1,7-bisphosphate phosphatase